MKLDIYNHVLPMDVAERMQGAGAHSGMMKRLLSIPTVHDMDARLRMLDGFGEYSQILSLSGPPLEVVAGPAETPALARLANNAMAAICARHPDRFPGFIASLPMNNPDAALAEIGRSIDDLGAKGIQIFTPVGDKALDEPEFLPLFERMAACDLPIWLHPARGPNFPDYPGEGKSKFEIWFALGWPYDTSAAMARLVFSGLFDRLPDIKIITHHMGGMIPYFEGRVGIGWDELGTRTDDEDYGALLASMKRRPLDYFKMFYADTALNGAAGPTRCGLDFFGAEHCLFATDYPFDPEGGALFVRETTAVLDGLEITREDRDKLYLQNARRLLKLDGA